MVRRRKDAALAEVGRMIANRWGVSRYGSIKSLSLDSATKRIAFSIVLRGESEPVGVEVFYRVECEGARDLLVADRVLFTREWANLLFRDFCPPDKKQIELPPLVARLL